MEDELLVDGTSHCCHEQATPYHSVDRLRQAIYVVDNLFRFSVNSATYSYIRPIFGVCYLTVKRIYYFPGIGMFEDRPDC
jgi:hypothetical protein